MSIAEQFAEWGHTPPLIAATFGTESPVAIAATFEQFVAEHFDSAIAGVEFVSASVGLVVGLRLGDDTRTVIKVHRGETSTRFLTAMQTVQRFAAASGYPCPVPMLAPTPLGTGLAVAESTLVAEDRANAHRPAIRRAMAGSLAELVRICRSLDPPAGLDERPLARVPGALWPPPHDLRFDFDATAVGAEWIDEIAVRAAAQRDSMPGAEPVVGHSDWSAQNVRFHGEDIAAVYDWDSVALEQEAILLGQAAHAFSADWSVPGKRQLPSATESRAFIADYETARGAPLSAAERRVALGALVYARSYAARCAHSDVVTGFGDPPGNTARSSLRTYERLLEG
jgi:hypothetical protein